MPTFTDTMAFQAAIRTGIANVQNRVFPQRIVIPRERDESAIDIKEEELRMMAEQIKRKLEKEIMREITFANKEEEKKVKDNLDLFYGRMRDRLRFSNTPAEEAVAMQNTTSSRIEVTAMGDTERKYIGDLSAFDKVMRDFGRKPKMENKKVEVKPFNNKRKLVY